MEEKEKKDIVEKLVNLKFEADDLVRKFEELEQLCEDNKKEGR